jgi:hypothetical protein
MALKKKGKGKRGKSQSRALKLNKKNVVGGGKVKDTTPYLKINMTGMMISK